MTDISLKILESAGTIVEHSRDNVIMHEYNGKKYYVKQFPMDEKSFKILLYFKLLEFMGIKTPNITTYTRANGFNDDIYIISEECGKKSVSSLGELPKSEELRQKIARIIYTADLLGLGDIATDNIIQSENELFLIDFEALNTNRRFPAQNPFENMGEDKYSVARSFDLHNTKGQIAKLIELPTKGALNDLELDESSKKEIEERFFSLNKERLHKLAMSVLIEQFPEEYILSKLPEIFKELTERYEELDKSRKRLETEVQFEEIEQTNPIIGEKAFTPENRFTMAHMTNIHYMLEIEELRSGLCGRPVIDPYKIAKSQEEMLRIKRDHSTKEESQIALK